MIYKNTDLAAVHAMEVARTGNYDEDDYTPQTLHQCEECGRKETVYRHTSGYILCRRCLNQWLFNDHPEDYEEVE